MNARSGRPLISVALELLRTVGDGGTIAFSVAAMKSNERIQYESPAVTGSVLKRLAPALCHVVSLW